MRYIVGIDEVGRAASKRRASSYRYVIGIDEVGRGSLAGPVVVAAVLLPRSLRLQNLSLGELRDSKRLTPRKREAWFHYLKTHPDLRYTLARVYPRTIERINITKAANRAALRAFLRLLKVCGGRAGACSVYLDGGLYLGQGQPFFPRAKTVVRGDDKISAIKAASIVAKVSRDRLMVRLAKKFPQYGFEIHKGYGTVKHRFALARHGPTSAHRATFLS